MKISSFCVITSYSIHYTKLYEANQLTGVTMHEPGVSRLVAVDIDAAVEMVAV